MFWVSTADFGISAGRREFSDFFPEVPVTKIRVSAPAPYKNPTAIVRGMGEDASRTRQSAPGKWGRPRRGLSSFSQIPCVPVKIQSNPLKSYVYRDAKAYPDSAEKVKSG